MSLGIVSGRQASLGAGIAACSLFAVAGTGVGAVTGLSLPTPLGSLGLVALGMESHNEAPSWTELAVEKLAGLLALATGAGLLAPLVVVLRRGEADGVGAVVVGVLGVITLIAGVALLLGQRSEDGSE